MTKKSECYPKNARIAQIVTCSYLNKRVIRTGVSKNIPLARTKRSASICSLLIYFNIIFDTSK